MCSSDIFLGVLAILFPPIAVWIKCGLCSADSIINILLCMLGYLPGLLHAWYIIAKFPEGTGYQALSRDVESGHVTCIYVQGADGQQRRQQRSAVPKNSGARSAGNTSAGYGTTASAPNVAPQQHQAQNGTWSEQSGESSNGAVPPSYAEAIRGDHKVQTS